MRLHLRTQLVAAALAVTAAVLAGTAGVAAAAPAAAAGDLKLYVFDCGGCCYNSAERFGYKKGEISPTNLTDGCYLIDNPGKGTLIWDTGVIPDHMWGPGRPPPKKEYGEGVAPCAAQLEQTGHKLEDITYVALSHVHWDHVANLYQFAKSTWLTSPYTRQKVLFDEKGDKIDPSMFTPMKTAPLQDRLRHRGVRRVRRRQGDPHPHPRPHARFRRAAGRLKNHKPVILAGDL